MLLTSAWLGYDLPYETIEAHPQVKQWRANGLEKRIKRPEHHLTVGFFESVDVDALGKILKELPVIEKAQLTFDGYGEMNGYIYLTPDFANSPSTGSGHNAVLMRQNLLNSGILKENKDFHVSIGGPDSFSDQKPRQHDFTPPLSVEGKLVLVGKSGNDFKRFVWNDGSTLFVDEAAPMDSPNRPLSQGGQQGVAEVHTIAMFPKIQADTATAAYLLARFGKDKFPGVDSAQVVFWTALPEGETAESLLQKGTLTIDLGGLFDHHLANQASGKREETASSLVAKYLGLADQKAFQKILAWAKRDDLEGKGTISTDPLDRAFGLSGLMMNLNRAFSDNPKKVLDYILPLLHFHVLEEQKRAEELPKEWEELQANGNAQMLKLKQGPADLKAAFVNSENVALPGFLRAAKRMDMVIQRRTTNHTNIITRQERSIDLRPLIEALRRAEATKKQIALNLSQMQLQEVGRIDEIPEWYYDDAANTIQNGGVSPGDTPATQLSADEILTLIKENVPKGIIGSLKKKKAQGR